VSILATDDGDVPDDTVGTADHSQTGVCARSQDQNRPGEFVEAQDMWIIAATSRRNYRKYPDFLAADRNRRRGTSKQGMRHICLRNQSAADRVALNLDPFPNKAGLRTASRDSAERDHQGLASQKTLHLVARCTETGRMRGNLAQSTQLTETRPSNPRARSRPNPDRSCRNEDVAHHPVCREHSYVETWILFRWRGEHCTIKELGQFLCHLSLSQRLQKTRMCCQGPLRRLNNPFLEYFHLCLTRTLKRRRNANAILNLCVARPANPDPLLMGLAVYLSA